MTDKYYFEHQASEDDWLKWFKTSEQPLYKNTQTTVDLVVVRFFNKKLHVLMSQRLIHPFKDKYSLPGSYIQDSENSDRFTTKRIISDKLSEKLNPFDKLQQLQTYSQANRDPRGRVVSIAYILYTNHLEAKNGYQWIPFDEALEMSNLAFDHDSILYDAWNRMKDQFLWQPYTLYSLGNQSGFTLGDMVNCKAYLFNQDYHRINRANLRKKMLPYIKENTRKNNVTYYYPNMK